MKKILLFVLISCLVSCSLAGQQGDVSQKPSNLLVEGLALPLNVHAEKPSLTWYSNVQEQTHYQIQVASSSDALQNNKANLWDSGKIASSQSVNVAYDGSELSANTRAYWRVRVWAKDDENSSVWSAINRWEMGLLAKSDWKAKWIKVNEVHVTKSTEQVMQWMRFATNLGTEKLNKKKHQTQLRVLEQVKEQAAASLFRYQFNTKPTKKIVRAKLHSTAGGYYEIFLNGKKVDDRVMDPGQTDFDKRILYNSDDVSPLIQRGENTLAVHLGSGWYHEFIAFSKPEKKRFLGYGQPTFIAQLELTYDDGSKQIVASNENWLTHSSPIIKEGIFSGELYDANYAIKNWNTNNAAGLEKWMPAKELNVWPTEKLEPQLLPAIRAVKEITPVAITNPSPNVWVLDFGQNFTGIPTVNIKKLGLQKGQAFFMRYGEWVNEDGSLNQRSGGGAPLLKQVDGYIASGDDTTTWTPIFTWHGYRYLEVSGLSQEPSLNAFTSHLLRSSVERVGHFESSDPLLNRIHDVALWGYETNLMALPMDCPIRERAGWTGDAHAALITGNYNFDMANFWQKYLVDFETSAYVAPAVVPGKRSHGGNFDWAAAEIMIAWEHYRHHGNTQLLAAQYESMVEYMQAGEAKISNNLLRIGYGDWCDPVVAPGTPRVNGRCSPQHTTPTITSSALFAHTANLMSKISGLLNKPEQEKHFAELFSRMSEQFNTEFYNEETGHYGSQTADAMAIMFGITPEALRATVAKALNDDVINKWSGHASVGALGQTYVYRALSDYGYGDTAFNIFKAEGYPGYAYLFNELNATTLWERKGFYDPKNPEHRKKGPGFSLNHPFHSGYDGWFYEGLGGIRPLGDNPGYQNFVLRPVFPKALNSVSVSYKTGYGKIVSQWERKGEHVIWIFEVPNNSTAKVILPNEPDTLYKAGKYNITIDM